MTPSTSFFVPGRPRPQPRARGVPVKRGDGTTGVRMYTPSGDEQWYLALKTAIMEHFPYGFGDDPAEARRHGWMVTMNFYMPRPKRLMTKRALARTIPHTTRPDVDNLVKFVLDVITGCGVWVDDRQVCAISASKAYAPRGGLDGVYLELKQTEVTR